MKPQYKKLPEVVHFSRSILVHFEKTVDTYVIHYDHWWNPAVMWQAEDRVHRQGQKKKVNVFSFWMKDTIEVRIKEILKEKGLLIENVIDSLATNEINKMISTQEWLDMLGVKTNTERYKSRSTTNIEEALHKIKSISPIEFENITKEFFKKIGYLNAKTTKKSYDGGIDIYGSRIDKNKEDIIVAQCKRTSNVSVKVVRELLGVISNNNKINKGYLITSGDFTSECQDFAKLNEKLILYNGLIFAKHLIDLNLI